MGQTQKDGGIAKAGRSIHAERLGEDASEKHEEE